MSEPVRRSIPAWLPAVGIAAALAALVAWSFAQRWSVLAASPFPLGIDGYFYPVQLRSLLEHGELQYPASPLAFWLLAPFAAVTDPITGAKLGAALLGALVALPAYGVGAHLGRDGAESGRGPGLVAAALATSSAGSMYMTIEFVKNGIGITVALTALWLVLRALAVPSRRRIALSLLGIAAAVMTHKMAAALVIGIAVPAALVEAHAHRASVRNRFPRWLVLGVLLGLGLLLAGALAPQRFLSPTDTALLDGLFTTDADWSLPVLSDRLTLQYEPWIALILVLGAAAMLIVDRNSARGRVTLAGTIVAITGVVVALGASVIGRGEIVGIAGIVATIGLVAIAGGVLLWRVAERLPAPTASIRETDGSAGTRVVAWCVIALGVLIGLPWLDANQTQGLALRLRVISFVPLALGAAIVLRVLLRYVMPAFTGERKPTRTLIGGVIAVAVVVLHVGGEPRTEGEILAHPALVSSAYALTGRLPADAVAIVPERHIAFMVAWYARVPVSIHPDGIDEDHRWRVMPLSFISKGDQLDGALLEIRKRTDLPRVFGLHPHHPDGMVAVPERTWREVLKLLPADERDYFLAWHAI